MTNETSKTLFKSVVKTIEEIAAVRIRYGYRRIHILLEHEGWWVNLKRVYHIYCLAGLNLRNKRPLTSSTLAYHLGSKRGYYLIAVALDD